MSEVRRRPIVGVMGSGAERHERLAGPLGRWVAERGWHLLTGGGAGVMAAASEAFVGVADRAGLAIGILKGEPQPDGTVRRVAPNPWVELPIRTHLPLSGAAGTDARSRNHVNVLTADVVVALPGGEGTRSEVVLAVRYGTPVIAFLDEPALPVGWPSIPVAATIAAVTAWLERAAPHDRG